MTKAAANKSPRNTNKVTTAKAVDAKGAAAGNTAETAGTPAPDTAKPDTTKPDTAKPDTKPADTGATAAVTEQNAAPVGPNGADDTPVVATPEPVVVVDPFAGLPVHTIGKAEGLLDMSTLEVSQARKYDKVHTDASQDKLPVLRGWKHSAAMLTPGTNKGGENGFKVGSVYGIIADIVRRAGKAGIPAYEVATELRKRSMGANKRSWYCDKLPPVGWAEGWLNSAITKNIAGVHATKKAPALTVADTAAKDTEATPEQNAKAIADQTAGKADKAAPAADAKGEESKAA
jgi:hypothetical protein